MSISTSTKNSELPNIHTMERFNHSTSYSNYIIAHLTNPSKLPKPNPTKYSILSPKYISPAYIPQPDITQLINKFAMPNFIPSKKSTKPIGSIKCFAANSHAGLVRNYNEDRVAIIINMAMPSYKTCAHWPRASLFAIYDGHGGSDCSNFLRDNLHTYIIQDQSFPENPREAIEHAINQAEQEFIRLSDKGITDRSGSCALLALFVDDRIYIANVGDSRAFFSVAKGSSIRQVTTDHRPDNPIELNRILSNGGKVYKTPSQFNMDSPLRVLPGRLSVSRTIGDIHAKLPEHNGKPNVVICQPDIYEFAISLDFDFLFLGCDGIFERAQNIDISNMIWKCTNHTKPLNEQAACAADNVIKYSAMTQSTDNLTGVIICFSDLNDPQIVDVKAPLVQVKKLSFDLGGIAKRNNLQELHSILKTVKFPSIKSSRRLLSSHLSMSSQQ